MKYRAPHLVYVNSTTIQRHSKWLQDFEIISLFAFERIKLHELEIKMEMRLEDIFAMN